VVVSSPHLAAAGAAWTPGPTVGGWIAPRLGPFGPSVGHAVPLGYEAYAVVPIVPREDGEPEETLGALDPLLEVLAPFTGGQPVHTAMWDGWGWWHPTGTAPRPAGVGVHWDPDGPQPSPEELARLRAEAQAEVARDMVEVPDVAPLDLPHRRYHVWTGPLRSAAALRSWLHNPPSLIWPRDRSWFVGIPIYTFEIAVGGASPVIDAILAERELNARRVGTDDVLDGDD
jgi:hypothetical protein